MVTSPLGCHGRETLKRRGLYQDLWRSTRRSGATSSRRSWQPMRGERRALILALQIALLVVVVGAWEVAARLRWIDPFFFSQPSVFGTRAVRWLTEDFLLGGRSIYHHLFVTMEEMIFGFLFGVVGGVAVGFALGRSKFWSAVLNPYIQVLNALPRLVLAPIL